MENSIFLMFALSYSVNICVGRTVVYQQLNSTAPPIISYNCTTPCAGDLSQPVCGSNGRTYGSKCEFDYNVYCLKSKMTILRMGTCTNCMKLRLRYKKELTRGGNPKYIPHCKHKNGHFKKKQCTRDGRTCFCVTGRSGSIIYGPIKTISCRDICSRKSMTRFLKRLLTYLQREYQKYATSKSERRPNSRNERSVLINLPNITKLGEWSFSLVDQNGDKQLDKKEIINAVESLMSENQTVRNSKKLFRCRKSFVLCDRNGNELLEENEWLICLGLKANNTPSISKHRKPKESLLDLMNSLENLRTTRNVDPSQLKRKNCSEARSDALNKNARISLIGYQLFVPECTKEGFYEKKQCHHIKSGRDLCFCMDPVTGAILKRNKNCYLKRSKTRECNAHNNQKFLHELSKYIRHMLGSKSTKKFSLMLVKYIDSNGDRRLTRREIKPFRMLIKRYFKGKNMEWRFYNSCAKQYIRACDNDGDRRIDVSELNDCMRKVIYS